MGTPCLTIVASNVVQVGWSFFLKRTINFLLLKLASTAQAAFDITKTRDFLFCSCCLLALKNEIAFP